MNFSDYAKRIRALGRELTPEVLGATRALVAPAATRAAEADKATQILREVAYGASPRQRLDLFTAAGGEGSRPTLIYVHGGGFVAGNKHSEGSPFYSNIGLWAARNGYNGVVLTYRLAPQQQWPSGIEDLHLAVQFLRQEGARYGVGQGPLFLMGQSAGAAHVASYLAHPEMYPGFGHELAGAILLSGLYDFTSMQTGPGEEAYLGDDKARYAERSALTGLVECAVPLLVSVAEMDPPVFEQQGLQLLSAWQARHRKLPRFVHGIGQNHLSSALYLGLEGDLLAPQLAAFIREYAG